MPLNEPHTLHQLESFCTILHGILHLHIGGVAIASWLVGKLNHRSRGARRNGRGPHQPEEVSPEDTSSIVG